MLPPRRRRLGARRKARRVGLFEAPLQRAGEIADVIGALGLRLVWHRLLRDEIEEANGLRRHAHLARAAVDQPLENEGRLGSPGAAIGVDGHGVGVDSRTRAYRASIA